MEDEDLAAAFLREWFHAKVHDSTRYNYHYPRPMDTAVDPMEPDLSLHSSQLDVIRTPCKEIAMAPHQLQRLVGILQEIVNPESRATFDNSHPLISYGERLLRQQEYERQQRKANPMLQSIWDQYQTALKLCR